MLVSSTFTHFSFATVYHHFCSFLDAHCYNVASPNIHVAKSTGSITVRKRKDSSAVYSAQFRLMQKGKTVYKVSQTFDRKTTPQAWLRKRETEAGRA
jgi:hypothetical protein